MMSNNQLRRKTDSMTGGFTIGVHQWKELRSYQWKNFPVQTMLDVIRRIFSPVLPNWLIEKNRGFDELVKLRRPKIKQRMCADALEEIAAECKAIGCTTEETLKIITASWDK